MAADVRTGQVDGSYLELVARVVKAVDGNNIDT